MDKFFSERRKCKKLNQPIVKDQNAMRTFSSDYLLGNFCQGAHTREGKPNKSPPWASWFISDHAQILLFFSLWVYSFKVAVFCCSSVPARDPARIAVVLLLQLFPPPTQPLLLTRLRHQCTSEVGGGRLPAPWDWPGIKITEARRRSRHTGAKKEENKHLLCEPKSMWLSERQSAAFQPFR